MNDLILYTADNGRSQIKLQTKDKTVWLSRREMAQLFEVSTDNVGLHLKNIFAEGELEETAVPEESSVNAADGKSYRTNLHNLDAIPPLGVHRPERVLAQGLRDGRRAAQEPR